MSDATAKQLSLDTLLERHDREFHTFKLLSEPEQARTHVRNRVRYARDPWSFLKDCVYTLDQVDSLHPIKPFPSDLEYLAFLTQLWLRETLMAIPKSRRMTCSWNFIALFTHDTIFREGRFNGFVSKKEDDAAELVARAEFIYHHIPDWRIPRALLPKIVNEKMTKQPPILAFEGTNSKIQGFPMGSDQLRQFTLSGIFGDEAAFWPDAQKFYSGSKPTTDGGGRLTLVSSRSPGFFKKIVFDQLDAPDLTFPETPPVPTKSPMTGVEVWKNPRNKFCVVDLHYTANPAKRSPEWREAVKLSMPIRDFLMEYEKSWQTYEGKPVYEDFRRDIHVSKTEIPLEPGLPIMLGWDFGLTPACVLAQLVGGQIRLIREFVETDGSIRKLAPVVWKWLSVNHPQWTHSKEKIISFVDPAGNQRAQTDEKTCVSVLREENFKNIVFGPVDWETRRGSVEQFLIKISKAGPALWISEKTCPVLVEGFAGGYAYPKSANEIQGDTMSAVKNKFSHPHDALQYLCAGATAKLKQYGQNIRAPEPPTYGFQT